MGIVKGWQMILGSVLWDLNLIAVGNNHWKILCRVLSSDLSCEKRALEDWIMNVFFRDVSDKLQIKVNLPFSLKFHLSSFG